jgi:hypothetical protein
MAAMQTMAQRIHGAKNVAEYLAQQLVGFELVLYTVI